MNKLNKFKKLVILSCFLFIFSFCFSLNAGDVSAYEQSRSECVMEMSSGRVLHSVNENEKLPIASTTKVLTALTVIKNFNLKKQVVVPKQAVGIEGSSVYLREGERLTVEELLYCLMLRSGNDAAECLANTLTNSREEFISLMNKTAKDCGAVNSCFLNPHGLPQSGHYSTAYDLCLIAADAMKNDDFRKITSTKRVEVSNDGFDYKRVLINKNKLLFSFEGATGIKTGYTKQAGRCLVSGAKRNGIEVVCVVLNSNQMWERSKELLDDGLNNYKTTKIFDSEDFFSNLYKTNSGKIVKFFTNNDFYYPIANSEAESINFKINDKTIEEYALNPQKTAEIKIFLKNELIFSQKIYSIYIN